MWTLVLNGGIVDITVKDLCCSQDRTLKRLTPEPFLKYNGQLVYWEHQDIFSTLPWNHKVHFDEWALSAIECPLDQHTLQPSTGMKTCFHIRCAIARSCHNQRTASIIAVAKHISYGPHCPCKAQVVFTEIYIVPWMIYSKRVGPIWHDQPISQRPCMQLPMWMMWPIKILPPIFNDRTLDCSSHSVSFRRWWLVETEMEDILPKIQTCHTYRTPCPVDVVDWEPLQIRDQALGVLLKLLVCRLFPPFASTWEQKSLMSSTCDCAYFSSVMRRSRMTSGSCGSDLGLPRAFALGFDASAFATALRFGAAFALGARFGRAACSALLSFSLLFFLSAEHALGITDAGFSVPSFVVFLFLDMGLLLCARRVFNLRLRALVNLLPPLPWVLLFLHFLLFLLVFFFPRLLLVTALLRSCWSLVTKGVVTPSETAAESRVSAWSWLLLTWVTGKVDLGRVLRAHISYELYIHIYIDYKIYIPGETYNGVMGLRWYSYNMAKVLDHMMSNLRHHQENVARHLYAESRPGSWKFQHQGMM